MKKSAKVSTNQPINNINTLIKDSKSDSDSLSSGKKFPHFPFATPDGSVKVEESPEYRLQQQKLAYERQQNEAKVIFNRRQKEIKQKINEIRAELLKLAKEMGLNTIKIQKTLLENIPEPADYHLSFLEKVRQTLVFIRRKVSQSKTWLDEWQTRSAKRNYYWYHFKKGGAKFWLSGERQVATQTG